MTTYTLSLRNNATGESVVSFTVSEHMYKHGDLGRIVNDCVGAIQSEIRALIPDTPSAGFSEASKSSGEAQVYIIDPVLDDPYRWGIPCAPAQSTAEEERDSKIRRQTCKEIIAELEKMITSLISCGANSRAQAVVDAINEIEAYATCAPAQSTVKGE